MDKVYVDKEKLSKQMFNTEYSSLSSYYIFVLTYYLSPQNAHKFPRPITYTRASFCLTEY